MRPLLVLFAVAALAVTPVVQAQSIDKPQGQEIVWQLASKQVVHSLESEYAHVRAQTLKNVIVFSTLYREAIDLRPAVKFIAKVAKEDVSDQNRRLAMAALQSVGTIRAKQHLAEMQGIDGDEYRTVVAAVLTEYSTKPNAM